MEPTAGDGLGDVRLEHGHRRVRVAHLDPQTARILIDDDLEVRAGMEDGIRRQLGHEQNHELDRLAAGTQGGGDETTGRGCTARLGRQEKAIDDFGHASTVPRASVNLLAPRARISDGHGGYFPNMPARSDRDEPLGDLVEDAESNEDETTRREALELDLEARGRSKEGEAVGDQMD